MSRRITSTLSTVRHFLANQDGVATVDWVLVCCSATAAGIMALNMGQETLGQYSSDVRDEVQGPVFQAAWTEQLDIPPEEYWGEEGEIVPVFEQAGDVEVWGGNETITNVVNGNGNNGHGNDADGCDSSNPGDNPNCVGDTTDDDGAPPGQSSGTTTTTTTTGGTTTTTTTTTTTGTTTTTTTGGTGTTTGGTTPTGGAVVSTQTSVTIVNAGFENTGHSDGQWSSGVPGWSINAEGSADVGDFNPTQWSIDESTVTGNNVAFL